MLQNLICNITCVFTTVDISIKFKELSYSINERNRNRPVQPVLVLSNPSSTDVTVNIQSNDVTATGM